MRRIKTLIVLILSVFVLSSFGMQRSAFADHHEKKAAATEKAAKGGSKDAKCENCHEKSGDKKDCKCGDKKDCKCGDKKDCKCGDKKDCKCGDKKDAQCEKCHEDQEHCKCHGDHAEEAKPAEAAAAPAAASETPKPRW